MRKLIIGAVTAALLAGGAGTALANPPNDENHPAMPGLCRAFDASENGRERSREASGRAHPLDALEEVCEELNDEPGNSDGR